MSSPALTYPSSGEFNVLVQRFKLLNLVQRVAHRDVAEMLDTVGLEGLSRKGTLSRWAWGEPTLDDDDSTVGKVPPRGAAPRHRLEENRPRISPSTHRVSLPVSGRLVTPPRMQFGRPTSGFDARIAAARWSSGMEKASSATDSLRRSHLSTRQNTAGEVDSAAPSTMTRRPYGVRRPRRILHRSSSEREAFFSRLAEPRQRPGALVEEVLLYDDEAVPLAHSRRGDDDAQLWRDTTGHHVSELAERDGRDRYDTGAYGRRCGSTVTSAVLAAPQRRPSPSVYAFHHKGSRSRSYAPLQPSTSSPHRRAAGPRNTRCGEEVVGELQGYQATHRGPTGRLYSQHDVPAEDDPHDVSFTAPPSRYQLLDAPSSSSEDPARVRSLSPALLGSQDAANTTPLGGRPHENQHLADASVNISLSTPLKTTPDTDVAASPITGGDTSSFATAAPTEGQRRRQGSGAAAGNHPPGLPEMQLPPYSASSDVYEVEDVCQGGDSARGQMVRTGSEYLRASGLNSETTSLSQFPQSPRFGRGLAPKAKPKGAVESASVPFEAVRQESYHLSRSSSVVHNPDSNNWDAGAQNTYTATSPARPRPRSSSALTPPTTSGFSSSRGLRSPKPYTVTVKTMAVDNVGGSTEYSRPSDASPLTAGRAAASPLWHSSLYDDAAAVATPVGSQLSATAKKSFVELSAAIDHMLLDHQQLLRQVYKETLAPGLGAAGQEAGSAVASRSLVKASRVPASDAADSHDSSLEVHSKGHGVAIVQAARYTGGEDATIEVDLDSNGNTSEVDALLHPARGELEDEMLLYTQLQHQLTQLDADIVRLGLESANDESAQGGDGERGADAGGASALRQSSFMPHSSSLNKAAVAQPTPCQRSRGGMPEAIVQRLCAYRMDNFQYIAYNERLWNTSCTSQFVFAQRLTAAITEECWDEVMAEVCSIMDDYVDGLADHELQ
ncbi:hypothetical protein MNV84_02697 [Leishmania braziliensis]|nr:hypothetical protein MNV84_02697 [Leishmania braziliensis]